MRFFHRPSVGLCVAVTCAAMVGACGPDPIPYGYTEAGQQRTARAEQIRVLHGVSFAPGTAYMTADQQARLAVFARRQIMAGDEVVLLADNRGGSIQDARLASVRASLAAQGIPVAATTRSGELATGQNNVVVASGRWVAKAPACPDWSKPTNYDPNNTVFSNFGCADAQNLGAMVANPRDLAVGQDPGANDGTRAAAAIERYRRDAVKQPIIVSTGSTAPSAGTAPSGAGAAVGTTGN